MKTRKLVKKKSSQAEIDRIVVLQADDSSKWDKPIHARRDQGASLEIPAKLAARAAFLARLHRQPSIERWLRRIIEERVEIEEAAFAGAKRELGGKNGEGESKIGKE